jgi:very-short-patch-repair endonuclease
MENRRCHYRLDFAIFCKDGKIAVECDNEKWHQGLSQQAKDSRRDRWLKQHNWVVFHFPGRKIKEELNICIDELKKTAIALGGII